MDTHITTSQRALQQFCFDMHVWRKANTCTQDMRIPRPLPQARANSSTDTRRHKMRAEGEGSLGNPKGVIQEAVAVSSTKYSLHRPTHLAERFWRFSLITTLDRRLSFRALFISSSFFFCSPHGMRYKRESYLCTSIHIYIYILYDTTFDGWRNEDTKNPRVAEAKTKQKKQAIMELGGSGGALL